MKLVTVEGAGEFKPISKSARILIDGLISSRTLTDLIYVEKSSERTLNRVRLSGISDGPRASYLQLMTGGVEMLIRVDAIISVNGSKLSAA